MKKHIDNRKTQKSHIRIISLILAFILAVAGIPAPMHVYAVEEQTSPGFESTVRTLLIDLVRANMIASATVGTTDEPADTTGVSDDMIISIFEEEHIATTAWSLVNLHTVVEKAVAALNDAGVEAVVDNSKITSYSGITMPLDYSLGDMMVEWARQNSPYAAVMDDGIIMEFYDACVANAGDDPYISVNDLYLMIQNKADEYASPSVKLDDKVPILARVEGYMTYREWVTQGNIAPAGTLFIGTWLLNAQTLNSTLYNKAIRSMAEDGQQIMYYKSELAGGRWRNISSASSLNDILPGADDVPDTDLMDYRIGIVVGTDGIPRDPKTGEFVDIFTITDPYQTELLPELKGARLQLDAGNLKPVSKGGSGSNAYTYDRLKLFFMHDTPFVHSDEMERVIRWWLEANDKNARLGSPVNTVDANSGVEGKNYGYGWRRSFLGFAWWSSDRHYLGFKKQYVGDTALLDMLQTFEEYDHDFVFYTNYNTDMYGYFRSNNLFNDWYRGINPITEVLSTRLYSTPRGLVDSILYSIIPCELGQNERRAFFGKSYSGTIQLQEGKAQWANVFMDNGSLLSESEINNRVRLFKDFWAGSTSIRDAETDLYDQQLKALEGLFLPLKEAGYGEEADRAMLLQEKIDASRRSKAYYNLVMNDDHNYGFGPPLNNLYSQIAYGTSDHGRSYSAMSLDYGEEGGDFNPDSSMVDIIGNAVLAATESYTSYDSLALKSGDTVAQTFEYNVSQDIINNAAQGSEAMLPRLQQLIDLDNILGSMVAHKDRELATLEGLQTTVDMKVQEKAHETADEEYVKAANDPDSSQETLHKLLKQQKAGLSAVFSEVQLFIKARVIRTSREPALDYIDQRIDWAESQKAAISVDAYGPYENEAINEHIEWLKNLKKSVLGMTDNPEQTPEMDKADLNLERMDLLDNGDLDGLDSLDKKIDNADKDIEDKRNRNLAILDGTGTASDKIDAELGLSNMDEAKLDIKKKLGEKLEDDDYDGMVPLLDAAGDIGLPVDDLLDDLERSGAPKYIQNYVFEANEKAKTSPFYDDGERDDGGDNDNGDTEGNGPYDGDGSGTGGGPGTGGDDNDGNLGDGNDGTGAGNGPGGDGSGRGSGDNGGDGSGGDGNTGGDGGAGTANGLSGDGLAGGGGTGRSGLDGDDLNDALGAVFGDGFDSLSDSDKAAFTAGLSKFAENRDDDELRRRAKQLLNQLLAEGNGFIYRQYLNDPDNKYVSLAAVDKCRALTRNRCVTVGDDVTMSQITGGSASYKFNMGSTTVAKNNGTTAEMDKALVAQSDPSIRGNRKALYPYILENASSQYLNDTCEYIPDTEWAILIAPSMSRKVIELLEVLDEIADEE